MDGWPLNIFKWFTAGSKSLQIFSQFAFLYYVYCTGTGIFYSRCTVRVGANDLYTVILFFWMNKSFFSFKKIGFVCINFCVSGSSVDISRDKMLFGFSLTLTSSRLMLLPKTSFVGVFFLSFSLSVSRLLWEAEGIFGSNGGEMTKCHTCYRMLLLQNRCRWH